MRQPTQTEQILDMFLLRLRAPDYITDQPFYTTGSIITAALMRIVVLIVLGYILRGYASASTTWTVTLFLIWAVGVFPAWRQYQLFHEAVDTILESTLCGKCAHFSTSNQVCKILDVHVTAEAPPCEGLEWEPRS